MFGRGSFSGASFSGSYGKLYAQAVSVTTTVTASITKAFIRVTTLLASVSNVVSIKKAISITLTQILDTVIVVLSTVGKHLVGMSIQVGNIVTINRLLFLFRVLSAAVSNSVTILKISALLKTFNTTVSNAVTITNIKARVRTISVAVVNNVTTSFKLSLSKLISTIVFVNTTISKKLTLTKVLIALVIATTTSIILGFVSRFGAIARNTYYANERIRTMVISKVRTLFANEGDRNG